MIDSATERTDQELIRAYASAQDSHAFAELQRRFGRLVFAACLRELGYRSLAEDASQAVFLLLSQRAQQLSNHVSLAGWLHQSAVHISRNLARQERRRRLREHSAMHAPLSESRPDEAWQYVEPELHSALESLRPMDREAVLLRFVQELTLAEVGQAFGLTENAARMRIQRALEQMAGFLRKRGVVLSAAFLGLLLTDRAPARDLPIPPPLPPIPSATVVSLARRGAFLDKLRMAIPAVVALGLTIMVGAAWWFASPRDVRVTAAERRAIFAQSQGVWSGTLEYADDKSQTPNSYPTTVEIVRPSENELRLTASYVGSSRVDETDIRQMPDGRFQIQNGGPKASHELDGTYEFIRLPDGNTAFVGGSPRLVREVRILFTVRANSAIIEEQNRTRAGEPWRFRNRFILKRNR